MAELVHQLVASTGNPHGLRAGVPSHTLWARCGKTWRHSPNRPMPAVLTGWPSQVTCPVCLNPPSWAEAGIPVR